MNVRQLVAGFNILRIENFHYSKKYILKEKEIVMRRILTQPLIV